MDTQRKACTLSTKDNPFDPFKEFDKWLQYDLEKQYFSCNLLARFALVSDELSDFEYKEEVEEAIDRIISIVPGPGDTNWIKVYED